LARFNLYEHAPFLPPQNARAYFAPAKRSFDTGPYSIAELGAEVGSANNGDVVREEGMLGRLHPPLTKTALRPLICREPF
jgi:hypothetical protein